MLERWLERRRNGGVQAFLEFDSNQDHKDARDIVITVKRDEHKPAVIDAIYIECGGHPLSELDVISTSKGVTVSDRIELELLTIGSRSYSPIIITARNWWKVREATVHWHFQGTGHQYTTKAKRKNPWGAVSVIK